MGKGAPLLALSTILGLTLPAGLQLMASPATAQTASLQRAAAERDGQRYIGVWALTDSNNSLFNVRLNPSGRAVSTIGNAGVPMAGSGRLTASQFRELGRWEPWGNGVRVDYTNGWTDWIYVSPSGMAMSSWQPGQSRSERPFNFGTAVKLSGPAADAVGVYSFPPAQAALKPYTATLLSNGLAFNSIDNQAGGIWHLNGSTVVIDWISGWRTSMSLAAGSRLQLRHWAPGSDRQGPPTGGIRQATAIE
jgi:hypothetical protein